MRIELQTLIDQLHLSKKDVALVMFPDSGYPLMSLNRLLVGRSRLNEWQVYRLATYTGLSIDALYDSQMFWKYAERDNMLRFTNSKYTALYDPQTGITKILLLEKQIAVHTLSPKTVTLEEYLTSINQIIINQSIQKP